jgi:hypothetical protein
MAVRYRRESQRETKSVALSEGAVFRSQVGAGAPVEWGINGMSGAGPSIIHLFA